MDAIIALSVMYKAFDNNGGFQKYFQAASPSLLGAVFGFGLLHGFGLSTRLQQLPLGDDPVAMLWRILSFNVGVYLLFVQLHGYQHDSHPNDFRFPAAEHRHAHEDMDVENTEDASRSGL